ncbi:MAG: hypothetical protein Q4F84_03825, partial [Fibrobacter sp.]|nr:hypothetical protein [Fibrobacter sp.]
MSIRKISRVILLVVLSSIAAGSKTFTVPTDIKTIQDCIDKAEEGDTVFVKKGIYREQLTLKDNVSLIGESATETILRGAGYGVMVTGADNALISGFTIENGNVGIRCSNVIPIIENVVVRSNKETGIHCIIA